jgi:hypothetical protein
MLPETAASPSVYGHRIVVSTRRSPKSPLEGRRLMSQRRPASASRNARLSVKRIVCLQRHRDEDGRHEREPERPRGHVQAAVEDPAFVEVFGGAALLH